MDTKVYSKGDILQKLAQDGFFVDFLTLNSFLEKYKIEAIFEDDEGNEFFDKSAYDILVQNVLRRNVSDSGFQNNTHESEHASLGTKNNTLESSMHSSPFEKQNQPVEDKNFVGTVYQNEIQSDEEKKKEEKKVSLENIKWYRWDDVSADLSTEEQNENYQIIDSDNDKNLSDVNQDLQTEKDNFNFVNKTDSEPSVQTQQDYWNSVATPVQNEYSAEHEKNDNTDIKEPIKINNDLNNMLSNVDDNEEDFDDIGLLSDSIQAQEKFQSYIVNELAKKNVDLTPPKQENAFKFDISEKTLNMIARAIAKKIAKQVSTVLSNDERNNTKLLQAEKKSQMLEQKVASLEEQNKKLKLLLVESNKNLNSYKPTFFGFYRFVRKKTKKRK